MRLRGFCSVWGGSLFSAFLNGEFGHMFIQRTLFLDVFLSLVQQGLITLGVHLVDDLETRFVGHIIGQRLARRFGIQSQRRFALSDVFRIVTVQRPRTGVDGGFLVFQTVGKVEALSDTVRVGDDDGRPS